MINTKKSEEIWNSIDEESVSYLKNNFENISQDLLLYLLKNVLRQEKFEIGIFKSWFQKASVVCHKEPQKQIELRAFKGNNYYLILSFFGVDDKQFVYKHKLTKEEVKFIPEWLRESMQNIKELDRPITIFNPLK